MKTTARRYALACSLLLLLGARPAAHADAATGAEEGWAAMKQCAALVDDRARHACTDEVLRRADLLPGAEAREAERRRQFGLQQPSRPATAATAPAPRDSPAPRGPSAPGASPQPGAKPAPGQPPERAPRAVELTLSAVDIGPDGKLVLTTAEGAVWRQVESRAVRPLPAKGEKLRIEPTSFGGFMCQSDRWTAFRCYRLR